MRGSEDTCQLHLVWQRMGEIPGYRLTTAKNKTPRGPLGSPQPVSAVGIYLQEGGKQIGWYWSTEVKAEPFKTKLSQLCVVFRTECCQITAVTCIITFLPCSAIDFPLFL